MSTVYFLVQQMMLFSIPLLIVALGGMFSERSGVVNIALEGIMVMGAFCSIFFINRMQDYMSGNLLLLLAVVVAAASGLVFSLLHAYAAINMRADQTISGTALNMISPAIAIYLARTLQPNGVQQIAFTNTFRIPSVPLLGDIPVLGPLLFQNQADVVYGIFAAMLIASVIMLFMEFFGLRIFVKLLSIPKYILLPCVFVLCTIGAYALKNNMSQVIACLIFGALGFAFKKLEIPSTPFILGFILGPLAEVNYRRGMIRTNGSFVPFLTSPISAIFLAIAVAVLLLYATKPLRDRRKASKA